MGQKFKPSQPPNSGKKIGLSSSVNATEDPDKLPPKFSFRYLAPAYCISNCTDEERLSFVDRMFRLSQLTWSKLRQIDRHKLGYELIDRKSIKPAIPTGITEDVKFVAFRFYKLAPMVGYRSDDGTFYVIWFDRNFKVYDHG